MELTPQRGAIPVDLDRTRTLFFDHAAVWALIQRFGQAYYPALYRATPVLDDAGKQVDAELELVSMDALIFFLHAGLQADAKEHGETLSLEKVATFIHPWNFREVFLRVVYAVVGNTATPAMLGKAPADAPAAKTPATKTAAKKAPSHPGPTRVTTSMKRSGSRTASSAGRKSASGRRR